MLRVGSTLALLRRLFTIAGPIMLTQLGMMGFGVVDTLMLGRVGIAELDAAALGNVWSWGTMVFGLGVMIGLDPIIAQAHGREDGEHAALAMQRGLVVAGLISIPLIGLGALTEEALLALGQDPELAHAAEGYVWIQIWSVPAMLGFYALRQYLQGREIVAPALWVTLIVNLANVLANRILIFGVDVGGLKVAAMGLDGAGLATGITRSCLLAGLALWIVLGGLHRGAWRPWSRASIDLRGLGEILRYGVPVGLQYTLELWAFQLSTLLAGELGREALAAHSITLNVAAVTFMIPFGISIGASTVIGNLIGAGREREAKRTAWIALGASVVGAMLTASVLVAGRRLIPGLYTDEVTVVALVAGILPIAAFFQLFDGLQVVGGGILRGTGDTLAAAAFNALAYYAVALPLAAYLVFARGAGLEAIWWSLALGLALVAGLLIARIQRRAFATRGAGARAADDGSPGDPSP